MEVVLIVKTVQKMETHRWILTREIIIHPSKIKQKMINLSSKIIKHLTLALVPQMKIMEMWQIRILPTI